MTGKLVPVELPCYPVICDSAYLSSSVQLGSQVVSISSYQAQKPSLSPVDLSPDVVVSPAALSLTDVNVTQHSLQVTLQVSFIIIIRVY